MKTAKVIATSPEMAGEVIAPPKLGKLGVGYVSEAAALQQLITLRRGKVDDPVTALGSPK